MLARPALANKALQKKGSREIPLNKAVEYDHREAEEKGVGERTGERGLPYYWMQSHTVYLTKHSQ